MRERRKAVAGAWARALGAVLLVPNKKHGKLEANTALRTEPSLACSPQARES